MHGPPTTQPAQQKGRPTWNVGEPVIEPSQDTQMNVGLVLGRPTIGPHDVAGVTGQGGPASSRPQPMQAAEQRPGTRVNIP